MDETQNKLDKLKAAVRDQRQETIIEILGKLLIPVQAIESFITESFKKIYSIFERIVFLLSDPDELIINENKITEKYGSKTVTYQISEQGSEIRITRNET